MSVQDMYPLTPIPRRGEEDGWKGVTDVTVRASHSTVQNEAERYAMQEMSDGQALGLPGARGQRARATAAARLRPAAGAAPEERS